MLIKIYQWNTKITFDKNSICFIKLIEVIMFQVIKKYSETSRRYT